MLLNCSSEHKNDKKCKFTKVATVLVQAHGTIISKHHYWLFEFITRRSQKHICEFYIKCVILLPT